MHPHVFSDSSLYFAVEALNLTVGGRVARRSLEDGDTSPLAHRCEPSFEFLTSVDPNPPRWIRVTILRQKVAIKPVADFFR